MQVKIKITLLGHLWLPIKKGKDEGYAMKRMQQAHQQASQAGEKSAYDKKDKEKKDKEKQLKEAIKSIIKTTLNEDVINEAATARLSDWGEGYETFEGVKSVVHDLENVVTEVETFFDKVGDKIAKIFERTSQFKNDEGLNIGAYIAPSLEVAFKQDLRPVSKKGFLTKISLPKVRTITQADVDANNLGERSIEDVPVKETLFTPNF